MDEKAENKIPGLNGNEKIYQGEDVALKTVARFFADELLPHFGIEGKVVSFGPTELVHIDIAKFYQDINLVMENGEWKHFEFQSTNEGLEGLKRFRVYEALSSYQNKVSVTTYVLYSGKIKNPMTKFTEGQNTYRIVPIIMQDENADELFEELTAKVERGEELTRADLVPLTLCMLMGGEMSMKDRVKKAYEVTRNAISVDPEDIRKIESVVYVMADKFLDAMDMEEILEGLSMTKLGRMLLEEAETKAEARGKLEGIEEGKLAGKLADAASLIDLLDENVIAERIGLPLEKVQELKAKYKETH